MPFAYYDKLSAEDKRVYRKSDSITRIAIPDIGSLMPLAAAIEPSLSSTRRADVERNCQALIDALNRQLAMPPIRVRVMERRPSNSQGELQGLYDPGEVTVGAARITVWMRTAQREQVVKFRTFLRTLIHEVCHHLDYELYKFPETFHTEGFYSRESSLLHQLAPATDEPGKVA